jgi:hypothetical protein
MRGPGIVCCMFVPCTLSSLDTRVVQFDVRSKVRVNELSRT